MALEYMRNGKPANNTTYIHSHLSGYGSWNLKDTYTVSRNLVVSSLYLETRLYRCTCTQHSPI